MKEVDGPVFIDTNIWLYALVETDDKKKSAAAKLIVAGRGVMVSTQVINEVCVNLLKKTSFAEQNINELIDSFYLKYSVVEINRSTLLAASEYRKRHKFSYWDSLIVACAIQGRASALISEDMHDGLVIGRTLTIRNPFAHA